MLGFHSKAFLNDLLMFQPQKKRYSKHCTDLKQIDVYVISQQWDLDYVKKLADKLFIANRKDLLIEMLKPLNYEIR